MMEVVDHNNKAEIVLYEIVRELKSFRFVKKIILFGSRARNDAEVRSDIDIAILCPEATDRQWLELCDVVDNIKTLLKIDIVRIDTASPELQQRISKEGKILYEQHN